MARASSCRAHCSKCNRHFASQKAFDSHIIRMEDGSGLHLKPRNAEQLRARTREGICLVSFDHPAAIGGRREGVTIWEHAGDSDRARERFAPAKPVKKAGKSRAGVASRGKARRG